MAWPCVHGDVASWVVHGGLVGDPALSTPMFHGESPLMLKLRPLTQRPSVKVNAIGQAGTCTECMDPLVTIVDPGPCLDDEGS